MEDREIVTLFWQRDERALQAAADKYGGLCRSIARNILADTQDAEECLNDIWLNAWNSIPPHKPEALSGYLAKLTRFAALKRWRDARAQKRGGGELPLVYEELADCIPGSREPDEALAEKELAELIRRFLAQLPAAQRRVFLCRYWYFDSIAAIAAQFGFSESKVKSMLHRSRKRLRDLLNKEGFTI
ncbi:MAG: sigma-70 family RNA polymerase sigma factor [Oscillospiraceae bacterium]|nr:sigma-70 family RNA polymerase sigma factor [Oscillospiraceae bacterium]